MSDLSPLIEPRIHWSPQTMADQEAKGERKRVFWTTRELETLREVYPVGGLEACVAALPGRSARTIYNKASALGIVRELRRRQGRSVKRADYPWTPHLDEAIRRAYAQGGGKGAIKALARQLGIPHQCLRYRALRLGIAVPRVKPPPWSEAELDILRESQSRSPKRLQGRLKAAGFARSESAVVQKLNDLGIGRRQDNPDIFSARDLAVVMGVDSHVPLRWIEQGWLKARQGVEKAPWRIKRKDIRAFLVEHAGRWDHRKCDIHWLIDMLAGAS